MRNGWSLSVSSAAHVHEDVGAAQRVEELQATVVDAQPLKLGACPAGAAAEEIPVARVSLARCGFQQHIRPGQAYFGQLHAAAQQGPHPHIDLDAVRRGHGGLFCPAGIGEGDRIGADRAGAAEVDIQVPDVQCAAGACLHRTLHGPLEPVPVPQREQHQYCRQHEDQDRQPAPATWAGTAEAPAVRALCSRGGGSIHAAMVAPSSWTGREASMCMACMRCVRAVVYNTCMVTATKWQTLPPITNRCQIACEYGIDSRW